MEELKEILKTAVKNTSAIEESLKGSFNKFAIDKEANFIIVQLDDDKKLRFFKSGTEGTAHEEPEERIEYIKAFLPGIEMILLMQDLKEDETNEFFDMMQDILVQSFEKSEFHTVTYAKHNKSFWSTSGDEWQPLKITDFIDLENFIKVIEKTI